MLAPAEATVSVLDAGFLLGDGLFESLRATRGVPYLLDRHLARLTAEAHEIGFHGVPAPPALAELVYATLDRAALEDAYLRITVTRGRTPAPLEPFIGPATIVIAALPAPEAIAAGRGVSVSPVGARSDRSAQAKSTSRQGAVLAKRDLPGVNVDEGIFVSDDGLVLEGISSNLFIVEDGVLLTPTTDCCLPGITRARVLELAAQAGIEFAETNLQLERVEIAREVFVTNAVQGVRAVAIFDARPLPTPEPGSIYRRLHDLYEADRLSLRRK